MRHEQILPDFRPATGFPFPAGGCELEVLVFFLVFWGGLQDGHAVHIGSENTNAILQADKGDPVKK